MSNKQFSSASYADSKPHYNILDGLRGAAALMVVWYHVFEGFAFAEGSAIDVFNHGYLAVDFFFMQKAFTPDTGSSIQIRKMSPKKKRSFIC